MKKTEAAQIIALDVVVWARNNNRPITHDLIEERRAELQHAAPQSRKERAARAFPAVRTIRHAITAATY